MNRVLSSRFQVPGLCRAIRALAVLGLGLGALAAVAAPTNAQNKLPPFDKATLVAWTKAGADVGWMGRDKFGLLVFQTEAAGLTAPVPAFQFSTRQEGQLSGLPDPARPFGLDLGRMQVTDAGLKGLARLKSLQALFLGATRVTDAGLKELTGLKSLQALYLGGTHLTDAGL